jgi:hypothetical protein
MLNSLDIYIYKVIVLQYIIIQLTNTTIILLHVLFDVQSFDFRSFSMFSLSKFGLSTFSLSTFGPIRRSVFRCSVPFEVRSFDIRSFSMFGLSRFGLSAFSLLRFGLSRFGHSRFGHGFGTPLPSCLFYTNSHHSQCKKIGEMQRKRMKEEKRLLK